MPDRPTLYVHCGLHKTGSTSLQAALRASDAALRDAGFLYPYAGSLMAPGRTGSDPNDAGHHNIGWYLTRNRLFDRRHGDLRALETELRGAEGHAILSSEFMECALHRPDALSPLRALADRTGRDLVLIVYLRNQIEYWDSLFHEMIKHGDGRAYLHLATTILETGRYDFRDSVNQFDYDRVLTGLLAWGGAGIILRNYHTLAGGSIVTDFATLLGLDEALRPHPVHAAANRRLTTAESLRFFYRNRADRRISPVESARIRHIAAQAPRPAMSRDLRQRFIDRFAEGNRRLCARFALDPTGLDLPPPPVPDTAPSLDDLFSFETQCLITDGTIPAESADKSQSPLAAWTAGLDAAAAEVHRAEMLWRQAQHAKRALRCCTRQAVATVCRSVLFSAAKR